ncbi:MAG: helix-turn-helix domain-containing protein [Candidatus Woesearchaeota archaeon]
MDQQIDILDLVLSHLKDFLNFLGITESVAKVWLVLILSQKPLTQKELVEKTNFSLSLVSSSLKMLERLGLIEKIGRGGKNKKYSSLKTLSDAFLMVLLQYNMAHVEELESKLNDLLQKKESVNEEELEKLRKEIDSLKKLLMAIGKNQR